MAKIYSTILLETENLNEVRRVVTENLGTSSIGSALHHDVFPTPNELRHGMEPCPDEPFFAHFDLAGFASDVDLYTAVGSVFACALAPIADSLARALSEELGCRAVVFLDGTNVPARIYEAGGHNGRWLPEAKQYLRGLAWIPRDERET